MRFVFEFLAHHPRLQHARHHASHRLIALDGCNAELVQRIASLGRIHRLNRAMNGFDERLRRREAHPKRRVVCCVQQCRERNIAGCLLQGEDHRQTSKWRGRRRGGKEKGTQPIGLLLLNGEADHRLQAVLDDLLGGFAERVDLGGRETDPMLGERAVA